MAELDARRARIFGSYAQDYERWRPGYPDAAVDWLVPPAARRVADVGAGTGKLTGALLARGLNAVAIEPDPDMLEVLTRLHPAAEAHLAGAHALPLPDASVDAVLVAQAWHWFPHEQAVDEVRRVLRPDGWLGLVWNDANPHAPWELELARLDPDLAAGERREDEQHKVPGLPTEELQAAAFPWTRLISAADLRASLATQSAFALMETSERERRLDAAAAVVAAEAARRNEPVVPLGQEAWCIRWQPAVAGTT